MPKDRNYALPMVIVVVIFLLISVLSSVVVLGAGSHPSSGTELDKRGDMGCLHGQFSPNSASKTGLNYEDGDTVVISDGEVLNTDSDGDSHYRCRKFVVPSGHTAYLPGYGNGDDTTTKVQINAEVIYVNGTINGNKSGYDGGSGASYSGGYGNGGAGGSSPIGCAGGNGGGGDGETDGAYDGGGGGGGAGYGGGGGKGGAGGERDEGGSDNNGGSGGPQYSGNMSTKAIHLGGGAGGGGSGGEGTDGGSGTSGGKGGDGGGAITIWASRIDVNGKIYVNGGRGGYGGNGGASQGSTPDCGGGGGGGGQGASGGGIMVYGDSVDLSYAVLQAEGGRGGNGGDGGDDDDWTGGDERGTAGGGGDGGNGGRIKVFYESSIDDTSFTWSVSGGSSGTSGSGDGTPDSGYAGLPGDKNIGYSEYHHLGSEVIVTSPVDQTETVPGTHTYNFHVKNNGSADDTYDLTISSSNSDWTATAPDAVSVTGGTNMTVSVDVTIPQDTFDGQFSDLTLDAVSTNGSQTDSSTTRVTYDHTGSTVQVTPPPNKTETGQGIHTYDFYVENQGNADDAYDLTVDSSDTTWTVTAPAEASIPAGTNKTVSVDVTIPQEAVYGDVSDITLTATSQNNTVVSDSNFTRVTYVPPMGLDVTAPSNLSEDDPGTYTYNFTVDNTGDEDDTYDLAVSSSNTGWSVDVPSQVTVGVGNIKAVGVEVTIPQDTLDGEFSDINLTATSQNKTALNDSDEMRVEYTHTGSDVIVTSAVDQTETVPGNHTYDFYVKNHGNADDTYDLTVSSSNTDWTVDAPATLSVGAAVNKTVSVEVYIPEDTRDGEYSDILLSASSQNGTQTDTETMRPSYDHTGSEVAVEAPGNETVKSPGNYTYHFILENNGPADDTYGLTVNSSNENWSVSAPSNVSIGSGQNRTIQVYLTIPQGADTGSCSEISLYAVSQNGTQSDEDTTSLTYEAYILSVQAPEHGTIYVEGQEVPGTEDNFTYPAGHNVTLEAVPDLYYRFQGWRGDNGTMMDPASNETTLQMLDNHSIWAEFVLSTHTLTLESTTGGTVTEPGEGTFTYNAGEIVSLTAVADPDHHFLRWSGENGTVSEVESSTTTITMESDLTITARFALDTYTLTIDSTSGGNVSVPGEGTFTYHVGQSVNIEAMAEENYHFVGWNGDNSTVETPTENQTVIEMQDNYSVTAEFDLDSYRLTVSSTEGGSVTEPGEGTFEYDAGTEVYLSAEADNRYHFVRWSGDNVTISDIEDPETIMTIQSDQTIQAEFALNTYELRINSTRGGNVTSPGEGTFVYQAGKEVDLSAVADGGYGFRGWYGDNETVEGSGNKDTTIVIEGDCSLTARFSISTSVQIDIVTPEGGALFNRSRLTIEWNSEHAEYHELRVNGEAWLDVGMNTSKTLRDMTSGEYTVTVRGIGGSGETTEDSVDFVVDLASPELEIINPEDEVVLNGEECLVKWQGSDELSGIDEYEIRLDSGDWKDLGTGTNYTFQGISEGDHTVEVKAVDESGNEELQRVNFKVDEDKPSEGSSFYGMMCNLWWILLLIAASILLAGLLFWRRRRGDFEEEKRSETGVNTSNIKEIEASQPAQEEPTTEWEETTVEEDMGPPDELKDTEKALEETVETMMSGLDAQEVGPDVEEATEEPVEEDVEPEGAPVEEDVEPEEKMDLLEEPGGVKEETPETVEEAPKETSESSAEESPEGEKEHGSDEAGAVTEPEAEKGCPKCGDSLSEDAEECPSCGAVLEYGSTDDDMPTLDEEIFYECEECGSLITEERDDCPYCGGPIKEVPDDDEWLR